MGTQIAGLSVFGNTSQRVENNNQVRKIHLPEKKMLRRMK